MGSLEEIDAAFRGTSRRYGRSTRLRKLARCAFVAAVVAGCGGGDDVGEQNERLADELRLEIDGIASETESDIPEEVACVRPHPDRFLCTAYFHVADDVALTARYRVVDCEFEWRALAIDAHEHLTVPAKLAHQREIDTGCAWKVSAPRAWRSGSFLALKAE